MNGKKSRLGCLMILLVLAALTFVFSSRICLWLLFALLALGFFTGTLSLLDAREMHLEMQAEPNEAGSVGVLLTARRKGGFLAAKYAGIELEMFSSMFGTKKETTVLLPLRGESSSLRFDWEAAFCGEVQIQCRSAFLSDLLELFHFPVTSAWLAKTVLYPQPISLQLTGTGAVGGMKMDGAVQNRRGNDQSEIFDIREYQPGDDVRAIHWKLSCKTDSLLLREASDPARMEMAVLPDLGLAQQDRSVTQEELNGAVAATIALCEQLVYRGTTFCFALPTRHGLSLHRVSSIQQLKELLPHWLSFPVAKKAGIGLQCFLDERLEERFSRLILISAGRCTQDLRGLEKRIGVNLIDVLETNAAIYAELGAFGSMTALPSSPKEGEVFRIPC